MFDVFKHEEESVDSDFQLQRMLKEYYKQGSTRPDFLESLTGKLAREYQDNPKYLLSVLGIISTIDDPEMKLYLLEKIIQEIVLVIVEDKEI